MLPRPADMFGSVQTMQNLSASIRALHSVDGEMNRRDRKTTDEDSARRDDDDVPDLWCKNPWLTSPRPC
jgi:hypothetical protein